MNIKEIQAKKNQLETDILEAVNLLFEKFKTETGISPDYISINLERLQTVGLPDENVIVGVSVSIKI